MSKKQYNKPEQINAPAKPEDPKPRRYVPPHCSMCTELRPAGQEFTQVYSTKHEAGYVIRHCRCGFCGNTFKHTQKRDAV